MTSSKPRLRRLSDFQGLDTSRPRVSGLTILELPVEIRMLIWEHAFGGKLIPLYTGDNRRLTHTLLDRRNLYDITADDAVTPTSIRESLETLATSSRNQKRSTRSTKLGVLASLRSCRRM